MYTDSLHRSRIQIMPTIHPVTAENMNYSSVITAGVMILAGLWYLISARKYYDGPRTTLPGGQTVKIDEIPPMSDDNPDKKDRGSI